MLQLYVCSFGVDFSNAPPSIILNFSDLRPSLGSKRHLCPSEERYPDCVDIGGESGHQVCQPNDEPARVLVFEVQLLTTEPGS
jgi:hypothetical protein